MGQFGTGGCPRRCHARHTPTRHYVLFVDYKVTIVVNYYVSQFIRFALLLYLDELTKKNDHLLLM